MAFNLMLFTRPRDRSEEDRRRIHFRMLANRGDCHLGWDRATYGFPAWWVEQARVYNRVVGAMRQRRLLPSRRGVAWLGDGEVIVWPFVPCRIGRVPGVRVLAVGADGETAVERGDPVALDGYAVYRLGGREAEKCLAPLWAE